MTAIARARWSLATMAMATAAPTAQKPAQANAETTREAKRSSYVGASAPATCPRPKRLMRAMRVVRRGSRRVATASSGAPTTMPIAKADMSRPACGMVTPMSSAMGGSRPESMNSLVPSANTDRPRTYTATGMRGRAAAAGMTLTNQRERDHIPRSSAVRSVRSVRSVRPASSAARLARAGASQCAAP